MRAASAWRVAGLGAALALALGLAGPARGLLASEEAPSGGAASEPIAFSHATHASELDCLDCHAGAATGPHAGMPKVAACLLCHSDELSDHPDEPKIRELADTLGGIPWNTANRMAGHVYFSHEAHVTYAEMECSECHGDVASRTEPITENHVDHLTMERCMDCHFERGATNDCLACHK